MKFLFIVQGEGRGHMTQAISLFQLLQSSGHEVVSVCIGKSSRREIPDFVKNSLKCPIHTFESPNFITDKKGKGILLRKTISHNLKLIASFRKSLGSLHDIITEAKPDVILNFYDILGGLYNFIYRPESEFWVIGHQYLIYHPEFPFAPNQRLQKWLFKINTAVTGLLAHKKLALSFRPLGPSQNKNLFVLPPLLRKEVKSIPSQEGDFYLAYMVNAGYSEEVMAFGKNNPDLKIEAFWDQKDAPKKFQPLPNITFHQVNDRLFLEKMAACKGLVCTAGFESVCEAMYFGKQVMVVPVQGQYEQACNAIDAELSGAGIQHTSFDFKYFDDFLKQKERKNASAKEWIDSFPIVFGEIIAPPTTLNTNEDMSRLDDLQMATA